MEWYVIRAYILIFIIIVLAVAAIIYLKRREANCTVPIEAIIVSCVRKSSGKGYGYYSIYRFTYNDEEYNAVSLNRRSEFKGLIEYGKKFVIYIDPLNPNIIRDSISIKDFIKLNPFISGMIFIALVMLTKSLIGLIQLS